ncbi:putative ATP binding protein [Quillaja saponaria]|uniref:ATP binding protein n=1 Tax=Quillaja saponaria TaxID=32244 RepID=A0AAD7PW06_QUISA|nr:putative ATP binding protein [Quillaja saponaria]
MPSQTQIKDSDQPAHAEYSDHGLHAELHFLRQSYQSIQSEFTSMEENQALLQQQRDEYVNHNLDLTKLTAQITAERDSLRNEIRGLEADFKRKEDEFSKKLHEELRVKQELQYEVDVSNEKIQKLEIEKEEKNGFLLKCSNALHSVKDCFFRIVEGLQEEKDDSGVKESEDISVELGLGEELRALSEEIAMISRLASEVESKVNKYKESSKKEKKELENSLVSLTEENRDINCLLRIALVEKEAVEKNLNKLKGNNEQKRVPILQIAERGLQRVGFGFMMGGGTTEQPTENSGASTEITNSDGSECEEVPSLASTVERIMKNLRLEITQLRRSMAESRSDTERLQSLTDKQAKIIAENTIYIKELEDRERVLARNVEELFMEVKNTEAEVGRWREACELEVEAAKNEIEERDKLVSVLKQELQKTKTALDISNGKSNLKEELASTAMAAQAAAERSLQLADRRAVELHERIEEQTRQLEEAEKRERNRHKVRRICWPWRYLKMNSASVGNTRVQNVKRMLPEMQALLH